MEDIPMSNNHKLIMESWRGFLQEARRDEKQAGLFAFETLKAIKSKLIEIKNNKTSSDEENSQLIRRVMGSLENEGQNILQAALARDEEDSILKTIKSYVITVEFKNFKQFENQDAPGFFMSYTGGGFSLSKDFHLNLYCNDYWSPNDSDNFAFFNDFKMALLELSSHELQHARQLVNKDSSKKFSLDRATSGAAGKDSFIGKIESLTSSFAREVKRFLSSDRVDRKTVEEYNKLNEKYKDDLEKLFDLTNSKKMDFIFNKNKYSPIGIIMYYMDPKEIEGYSKGWFFKSKRMTEADPEIRNQVVAANSREERIQIKRNKIKELFMKQLNSRTDYITKESMKTLASLYEKADEEFKQNNSLEDLKNRSREAAQDFKNKIIQHATQRYGSLEGMQ